MSIVRVAALLAAGRETAAPRGSYTRAERVAAAAVHMNTNGAAHLRTAPTGMARLPPPLVGRCGMRCYPDGAEPPPEALMESLKPLLAEHPFFRGLDESALDLIVGCAANVRFEPGTFIAREGQEANRFYLVRDGTVALEIFSPQRGPIVIQTLEAGDILGWSWLVSPYHWHFDARAVTLTRVIALDGKCLRGKCEEDHHLGYLLLKRFAPIIEQRLEATRLQLLDMYGRHPDPAERT